MVSFSPLIIFGFLAAAQVIEAALVPRSGLPKCVEVGGLSSENTFPLSHFQPIDNDHPNTLKPEQEDANPTIIAIEQSQENDNRITTIETKQVDDEQSLVRIFWKIENNNIASRFFKLVSNQKCRVSKSAQFAALDGASFMHQGTH